jgi:hypothetical protein
MNLTEIFANIKNSPSTNVLRDASGEYEDQILTCAGTIVNGGPQLNGLYYVGSKQLNIGDMKCISRNGNYCSFQKI